MTDQKPQPPLSSIQYREYNRLAAVMSSYHNHFHQTFALLYTAASSGKLPGHMSESTYIITAQQFCRHLTMHHTLEEAHFFPLLAERMPAFRAHQEGEDKDEDGKLVNDHAKIHQGIEELEGYIKRYRSSSEGLKLDEVKGILDGFRDVLEKHLNEEVRQLSADEMCKYWTLDEMRSFPF